MYPGLEHYDSIDESDLDVRYQQAISMLYSNNYICAVKNDFRNERLGISSICFLWYSSRRKEI